MLCSASVRRSETSTSTLSWPPAQPLRAGAGSGRWASLWLYLAMACVGGLLCAQSLLAAAVGPLMDAVAEEPEAHQRPADTSPRPVESAAAHSREPSGSEAAVCRAVVETGVPRTPRWSAGWIR